MLYKLGLIGTPSVYYAFNHKQSYCDAPASSSQGSNQPNVSEEEKTMQDLEKIFQENPYAASDPEEMERILQSRNKNKLKKPPSFSSLLLPIKIMGMCEKLDGLRFDISGGLSERFQLGASWNFSNNSPSNFTLMSMLILTKGLNPYSSEGMSFLNCKKDVLGKMECRSNFQLTKSLSFKLESYFQNANIDNAHVAYELCQEFSDWHVAYKFGGGSHTFSFMQTLTSDLCGGFEAMWHPQFRDFIFSYGLKYVSDKQTFIAQYNPLNKKEAINVGYINRLSDKLNLFGELKTSPDGFSESLFGFKLRFNSGQVTGTMNSGFKLTSSIQLMMESLLQTQINTIMDLSKPDKPCTFGIALSFGGGM